MEFNFRINQIFNDQIVKLTNTLLPPNFVGDRRAVSFLENGEVKKVEPLPVKPALVRIRECQTNVAEIVNLMGEASAAAQGLTKPITTSDKLRNSDHTVYLLIDLSGGSKGTGCVTGLLKVGRKGLYVFDPAGCHHQVKPLCVLDFYVHESRQRTGLGRRLFEYMLKEEDVEAVRLAIDRPSKKFLGFLSKHYGLTRVVPQMNNFVVFEGFFVPAEEENAQNNNSINLMASYKTEHGSKLQNGLQSAASIQAPTLGRYGAPRPPCSMGQIIHNVSPQLGPPDSSGFSNTIIGNIKTN